MTVFYVLEGLWFLLWFGLWWPELKPSKPPPPDPLRQALGRTPKAEKKSSPVALVCCGCGNAFEDLTEGQDCPACGVRDWRAGV